MDIGDRVPDFELPDQNGRMHRLSTMLADGALVLFFYPAAMTGGCTAETRHFRDLEAEFAEVGARLIGISADEVAKQRQFASANAVEFPLLSDAGRVVAEQFGVRRRFGPLPVKRHTFVIGVDGRLIAQVKREFKTSVHADRALAALRTVAA